MEAIFNHDGIFSLIADNSNINSPDDIMSIAHGADDYQDGSSTSHKVLDFADRVYKYYTSDVGETFGTVFGNSSFAYYIDWQQSALLNPSEIGMVEQAIDRPSGWRSVRW